MPGFRVLAASVACCALAAGSAGARPSSTAAKRRRAGELVRKAIAKSHAGKHAIAIRLYLKAYALVPQPLLLSNVGSEYESENRPKQALKYFCKYLGAAPHGANVGYATSHAKMLQIQLGHPVGDDRDVCKAPAPPHPEPSAAGTTGSTGATGPETPGASGTAAAPGGPAPAAPQPSGTASLTASSGTPHAPRRNPLEYGGIAAGGAGVIAFGVGIYFGVRAQHFSDEITHHNVNDPWPSNIKQLESHGKRDQHLQVGFMVVGGVAMAAGAVVYLIGHKRSATTAAEHAALVPTVTPRSVGLALTGGF